MTKKKLNKEKFEREISAGGLVFRRTSRGLEFAVMLDSYDKWTFPKGRVEAGEAIEEAAARETLEELGLEKIRLLEPLGKIDIWFRDRYEKSGRLVHKDVHYFLFQTPSYATLEPDPGQHSYQTKWILAKDLLKTSDYSDMVHIIERALALVKHQ